MIRMILNGAAGRMGKEVANAVMGRDDIVIVARVDALGQSSSCLSALQDIKEDADVIVDFSHHSGTKALLNFAVSRHIPVLIATTGHTEEELNLIKAASEKVAVFHSSNMSLGVAVLIDAAKKVTEQMPDADIEIVETHHNQKADAPSGTALMIAEALKKVRGAARFVIGNRDGKRDKNDIGILSVRRGNIVGIHEVYISTGTETITLKHEAHSRTVFADGAVTAAKFLAGKDAGLYTMDNIVK